ncbi:hypothetical protein NSND_62560 [Nitrospira sp. ND1]|nr:hypothetical protein NSND_62560 [Nitrospira sp. ND1]
MPRWGLEHNGVDGERWRCTCHTAPYCPCMLAMCWGRVPQARPCHPDPSQPQQPLRLRY